VLWVKRALRAQLTRDRIDMGAAVIEASGSVRRGAVTPVLLAIALASPAAAAFAQDKCPHDPPGHFEFYMLSLSWEPGWCATQGKNKHAQECVTPTGFGLHGLWPEDSGGKYPCFCGDGTLSASELAASKGVFADDSMVANEWPKHGTCTTLGAPAYFKKSKAEFTRVKMPTEFPVHAAIPAAKVPALKAAFVKLNPGLTAEGMIVKTMSKQVVEVDVCFTMDDKYRPCL